MPDLDLTWRLRAACADLSPDLFFSEIPEDVKSAQRLCSTCPVILECDQWATETRQEYGVWGGKLRSLDTSPIKHGTYTGYVRGCRRFDCAVDDGCAGAKRRYSNKVKARKKSQSV